MCKYIDLYDIRVYLSIEKSWVGFKNIEFNFLILIFFLVEKN